MTLALVAALLLAQPKGKTPVNYVIVSIDKPVVKDNELRLPYTVTNKSPGPVFLLNLFEDRDKLLRPPPRSKWSAELAPTVYLANEKVVVTWAGAVPRSARPGVTYFAPYTPLASRVAPGETFRATLRFELPLLEWNPYDPSPLEDKQVDRIAVSRMRVIVDVVRESDARVKEPSKEQPGAFQVSGYPVHRLAVEGELPRDTTVLRRRDPEFARMVPVEPPPPPNAPPGWKPGP